jgi:para-aminobenzoate synthetase / 4-amino-4-deoxychorismate lyase
MIRARFDDLTPGQERSFEFADPVGVLEARRADEVGPIIAAADAAASRGLWAAGFVSYEAAPGLDRALVVRERRAGDVFDDLPLAWFALFDAKIDVAALQPVAARSTLPEAMPWRASVDLARYETTIERIRELIANGQTYQVNHTIRLNAQILGDERGLYRDLALAQRGGYAAYLNIGRYRVLSASPELFLRVDGTRVTTRPMKGTAPRGRWLEEDERVATELVASEKDRAENAMIVDLLRNDLGRIALAGTVEVSRMFEPERYETVWQLTSTVAADLAPGTALVDVFRALFPSGSVTGAPKISTMRIIRALEDSPRGVYCGAVGYLAPSGSGEPRANFGVAIRTVVVDSQSGTSEYGVGGGITYDSSPGAEYAEILAKARVLSSARPAFELLESIGFEPDEGFRHLSEHFERLRSSAQYFGFRFDAESALAACKRMVEDAAEPVRIRLTLARDGTVDVTSSALKPSPESRVRLAIDDESVAPDDAFLFHKTTLREPYERRRAKRPDADDVLLVNTRGEVTESTVANVAVLFGDRWVTPSLDAGLLPGAYRAVLLRDGTLTEQSVTLDELRRADDVALVSSVRGWRPAEIVP